MVIDILRLHREGESARSGFVHSGLPTQDNIKACRGQHSAWLTCWLGPEWIVTSVAHVRFGVFYSSACVQTLRWLRLVGPIRICRHRWLQVAGCFPWLELTCVPARAAYFFCTFLCCCFTWLQLETSRNFLGTRFMEETYLFLFTGFHSLIFTLVFVGISY